MAECTVLRATTDSANLHPCRRACGARSGWIGSNANSCQADTAPPTSYVCGSANFLPAEVPDRCAGAGRHRGPRRSGEDAWPAADAAADADGATGGPPCPGSLSCPCATGADCNSGTCHIEADRAGACAKGCTGGCDDGDPCTADLCTPSFDEGTATVCSHGPLAEGAACEDGDACTQSDACTKGSCAGKALDCDDGKVCTSDVCDPSSGCVHAALGTATCSDGDVCTVGDACKGDLCLPGTPLGCDDGNPCTVDTCAAGKGCAHTPGEGTSCDDGSACTVGESCKAGQCVPIEALDCDDGNPCTTDACDLATGCTAVHADGNACTLGDECIGGVCKSGLAKDCDDGNACTDDACHGKTGCKATATSAACDDGSVCTVGDGCKSGKCVAGKPQVCNDGNPCTDDACDGKTGCTAAANAASCSDGSLCTVGDGCKGGKCAGGKPLACDDSNGCTSDFCAPDKGCQHSPAPGDCSDGNACTVADACKGGKCLPGKPQVCDDGNVGTADSCDVAKGCVQKDAAKDCNDGNVCTIGDMCVKGACGAGDKTLLCNDGQICTDDVCYPIKGCVFPPATAACDDGDHSTVNDVCKGGKCAGGAKKDCDDSDICTDDSCDPRKGCGHVKNNKVAFKEVFDSGKVNSLAWSFKAAKGAPGFGHSGAGHYRMQTGQVGVEHTMTLQDKLNLGCAGHPYLYLEQRYGGSGSHFIEVSADQGKSWLPLLNRGGATDPIWRRWGRDLSDHKGKKVIFRFRAVPGNAANYWDLRNIHFKEKEPPPALVPWGKALSCGQFDHEGPAWTCEGPTGSWLLNYAAVVQMPSVFGYPHHFTTAIALDTAKVKAPAIRFEERSQGGGLWINVRQPGGVWETVFVRGSVNDYVWRKRVVYLGKYQGKKLQVRFRTSVSGGQWGHIRKVQWLDEAPPPPPPTVAVPAKLGACKDWLLDGSAWTCDPKAAAWSLRYAGDAAVQYNTNGYSHHAQFARRLDLSKAKAPRFRFEDRRHRGTLYADVSDNGVSWTHIFSRSNATDYVWRQRVVDLTAYKGKIIWLRLRVVPHYPYAWGELRDLELVEAPPPPKVVPLGTPIGCPDWQWEGPSWTCDPKQAAWLLRYQGVTGQPSPNGYWQSNVMTRKVDLGGAKQPAFYFEARQHHGEVRVHVRADGKNWQQVYNRPGVKDHVWRKTWIDLGAFKGGKIELRFEVRPGHWTYWGEYRKLAFKDKPVLPTVGHATKASCKDWDLIGVAWKCDPAGKLYDLRYQGVQALPDTNVNDHMAARMQIIDLGGLQQPSLFFEARFHYGKHYVEVSEDGALWTTIHKRSNVLLPVFQLNTVDLKAWAGKKIHLRLRVRPGHHTYWGELRNLTFANKVKPAVVKPGYAIQPADWWMEGGWSFAAVSKRYELSDQHEKVHQSMTLQKVFDLSAAKAPVLRFQESWAYVYQYIDVSVDGKTWKQAYYKDRHGAADAVIKPAMVDLSAWVGQKTLHLRIRANPYYKTGHWHITGLVLQEKPVIAVVGLGQILPPSDWALQGLWQYNANTKIFSLNKGIGGGPGYLYPYVQSVRAKKGVDLSAAKAPTLYFEQRHHHATRYIDVSVDGGTTWKNVFSGGGSNTIILRRAYVDLSAFKGAKVALVRFRGRPGNPNYWWEIRAMVLKEKVIPPVVQPGYTPKSADWHTEVGWSFDAVTGAWELKGGPIGDWTHLQLEKVHDLSKASAPKLVYEEAYGYASRRVQVSADGLVWKQLFYQSNKVSADFVQRTVDLASMKGQPKVRVRFGGGLGAKHHWWRIRKVVVKP